MTWGRKKTHTLALEEGRSEGGVAALKWGKKAAKNHLINLGLASSFVFLILAQALYYIIVFYFSIIFFFFCSFFLVITLLR
jgi:hypothetical protein